MTRILIITALFALTACETIEGAGRDISAAGDAITNAAK
jgi:predicted small secreted protein